ncbi:MAG: SAM-dependent chlorinase/fluorinase [Coprothermobacterota bacterium]|nr:SAM-dependent chlorinase/fluorinase [Coprothermobacterota bacterium]
MAKQANKFLSVALIVILLIALLPSCVQQAAEISSPTPTKTIAFLTDYGTKDFYVGAVKGRILQINPEAKIVDITHEVTPFDIHEGAVTLLLAAREFSADTVFLAIVDPGVGTERRPIAAETQDGKIFVGPDNGLFTFVLQEFGLKEVRQITNESWMRPGERSYSFHGRDVFGPVAAHLSMGKSFSEIGPVITDYVTLPISPSKVEDGKLIGQVLWIDQYGNVQVNITGKLAKDAGWKINDKIRIEVGTATPFVAPFVHTYGDVPEGDPLIFQASTDFLEISINMGNMAEFTGAEIGAPVTLTKE